MKLQRLSRKIRELRINVQEVLDSHSKSGAYPVPSICDGTDSPIQNIVYILTLINCSNKNLIGIDSTFAQTAHLICSCITGGVFNIQDEDDFVSSHSIGSHALIVLNNFLDNCDNISDIENVSQLIRIRRRLRIRYNANLNSNFSDVKINYSGFPNSVYDIQLNNTTNRDNKLNISKNLNAHDFCRHCGIYSETPYCPGCGSK